jgi:hypothetical protein
MVRLTKKLARHHKSVARAGYEKAETRVMAAVGRRTAKRTVERAKVIAGHAAKDALIAGSVAAASVVVSELRKRHRPA